MYRYCVDNAVTFTPNDLFLFRESPFAVWMERLTLENPEHGIPPDVDTRAPLEDVEPQNELADTLRSDGRDVVLVEWGRDEAKRRADTLDAMRGGADFIVNGVLALGPLSGTANMLMRTSGWSDFGDYLYVPCDTQERTRLHSAFRLCFLADLLQSLQGQLPPQLLVVRGDADVVPLQTEDHIHYYRSVKRRFLQAMESFRKHRMPDPAASAHFGRWAECASEVLRQRAQSARAQDEREALDEQEELDALNADSRAQAEFETADTGAVEYAGSLRVAGAAGRVASAGGAPGPSNARVASLQASARSAVSSPTLAEQARSLNPDAFARRAAPGRTPNLALAPARDWKRQRTPVDEGEEALQNLAFIGSAQPAPRHGAQERRPAGAPARDETAAPGRDEEPAQQHRGERTPPPAGDDTAVPARNDQAAPPPPPALATATDRDDTAYMRDRRETPLPGGEETGGRAPPPNLRHTISEPEPVIEGYEVEVIEPESLELEPREPFLLPPDEPGLHTRPRERGTPPEYSSVIDLDRAPPPPSLTPVEGLRPPADPAKREPGGYERGDPDPGDPDPGDPGPGDPRRGASPAFSSSLITNRDFDDAENDEAPHRPED